MSKVVDVSGQRFGRLLVMERAAEKTRQGLINWICLCDCGKTTIASGHNLRRGNTTTCGCGRAWKHGQSYSLTYRSWVKMRGRCYDSANKKYWLYAGKGVEVCERWRDDFKTFLADMGERPSASHSIDRIDPNGNYEPGNCRWALPREQNRNLRDTKLNEEAVKVIRYLSARGAKKSLLGRLHKINPATVVRIAQGKLWA